MPLGRIFTVVCAGLSAYFTRRTGLFAQAPAAQIRKTHCINPYPARKACFGISFENIFSSNRNRNFKTYRTMENIETKAAKLGLDKGYYLLLMAILEETNETEQLAQAG